MTEQQPPSGPPTAPPAPPPKKPGGRPSRLTPELHDRIMAYVRAGNFPDTAAYACGVSRGLLANWLTAGGRLAADREAGRKYPLTAQQRRLLRFRDELVAAMAEAEAADVMTITAHGKKDWKALAWLLERRQKKRWQLGDRLEVDATVTTLGGTTGDAKADEAARQVVRDRLADLVKKAAERKAQAKVDAALEGEGEQPEGAGDPPLTE